jgi:hypothetical protein
LVKPACANRMKAAESITAWTPAKVINRHRPYAAVAEPADALDLESGGGPVETGPVRVQIPSAALLFYRRFPNWSAILQPLAFRAFDHGYHSVPVARAAMVPAE